MPKFEAKIIQKELEQNKIRPIYFIYGTESMKIRELCKRIQNSVIPQSDAASQAFKNFNIEQFEGAECSVDHLIDQLQSMSLQSGKRIIILKNAHQLKNSEELKDYITASVDLKDFDTVFIMVSKDLDLRKKFSKILVDHVAVIACEEVNENEKESWIHYLVKRKNLILEPTAFLRLRTMEPWSLDAVEQELIKLELARDFPSGLNQEQILWGTGESSEKQDQFIQSFFERKKSASLALVKELVSDSDEVFMLIGLMAWNSRMLNLLTASVKGQRTEIKLAGFILDRLTRWTKYWKLEDLSRLQTKLKEMDFKYKQTQVHPFALWTELVLEFCF